MKKILCIFLVSILLLSTLVLTSCDKEPEKNEDEKLKFGMGVLNYYESATNATEDVNGSGSAVSTVAAVLLDSEGKIVKCEFDTIQTTAEYTAKGKFISKDSFATKYELGSNYGMKSEYGSKKEWFEHADAFKALIVGKTIEDVKKLVAENGKGTDDVIAAGCTIDISDFVLAIEKAVKNAKASNAVKSNTLKVAAVTEQSGYDATEEKTGTIELQTSFVAAVTDADGKVVVSVNDCVQVKFAFDTNGAAATDTTAAIKTKLELGDNYGMKSEYGSKKEWYEHAAAFDQTCVGKTSSQIAGLVTEDGESAEVLQNAGCTIAVSGMVKAAVKATKTK